jgi:hypothetical protein
MRRNPIKHKIFVCWVALRSEERGLGGSRALVLWQARVEPRSQVLSHLGCRWKFPARSHYHHSSDEVRTFLGKHPRNAIPISMAYHDNRRSAGDVNRARDICRKVSQRHSYKGAHALAIPARFRKYHTKAGSDQTLSQGLKRRRSETSAGQHYNSGAVAGAEHTQVRLPACGMREFPIPDELPDPPIA